MAKKKKQNKRTLLNELDSLVTITDSESFLLTLTRELVQQMMITGLPDKSIRSYLVRLEEKQWDGADVEDVIWDIGEELASDDSEVLDNYVNIQERIYDTSDAFAKYQKLLKQNLPATSKDSPVPDTVTTKLESGILEKMRKFEAIMLDHGIDKEVAAMYLVFAATGDSKAEDILSYVHSKRKNAKELIRFINHRAEKFWEWIVKKRL